MDLDLDPDPWNWSVHEVQHFFRNNAEDYITDIPHSKLPALDPFLAVLEENGVSGSTLLTDVDAGFLREDCGISKLAERASVFRCIKKLKQQSSKFAADQLPQPPTTTLTATAQPQPLTTTPQASPVVTPTSLVEKTRSAEVQVQDPQGRKRRRLDISKLEPLQTTPTQAATPAAFALATENATTSHGYLSNSANPIDELFYGKTKLGQEIGDLHPNGNVFVYPEDREADMTDVNFQFTAQNKPIGEARYVYKQMKHFFSADEDTILHGVDGNENVLKRNGRQAMAFTPYRDGLSQNSRSTTVFQFKAGNDEPVPVREDLEHLQSGHRPEQYQDQEVGEWDFLVQKHKNQEDELLPVYGDSDDEDEDGDGSAVATEPDPGQDGAEEVDERKLSKERVAEIVDESIGDFIAEWQDSLEEREKNQAWSVWKQRKGSRTLRDILIQQAQGKIEHYTTRLNKYKKDFMDNEWRSESKVAKTCVVLQVTVEQIELERWKIGVWRRRQEPPHVVRHGTKTAGQASAASGQDRAPGLRIDPSDRLSVEPPASGGAEMDVDAEAEIRYEADDEDYHTPGQSPNRDDEDMASFVEPDEPEEMPLDDAQNGVGEDTPKAHSDSDTLPQEPLPTDDDNGSNYAPEEAAADSDDLPHPSTFTKTVIKSSPKSSLFTSGTQQEPLVLSSDTSGPKRRKKKSVASKEPKYKGDPMEATAADVDSWDLKTLKLNQDRVRILIKLLRAAGEEARERLYAFCKNMRIFELVEELQAACRAIKPTFSDSLPLDPEIMPEFLAASICLQWIFSPSYKPADVRTMNGSSFDMQIGENQMRNFSSLLINCLQKRKSVLFDEPNRTPSKSQTKVRKSSTPPIEISSDNAGQMDEDTPHNKRKRAVVRSEAAKSYRTKALQREQRLAESQAATNSTQLANMISSDPSSSGVEINPARDDDDDPIYICDRIARKIKPHQIDGVRFLWREITARDDDDAQGCVLAHTMGLGKTMQTIALLVAVNEATRSRKKATRRQIPRHLHPKGIKERNLRMLILCPPALIQNWSHEIKQWANTMLGHIFAIDNAGKNGKNSPANQLEEWMRLGGVVLLGYQRFRDMMLPKVRANQKNAMSEEQQKRFQDMLKDGPEIVIADEAHHLKNVKSKITAAAAQIETHSRIGLTGTPMSNDVDEIYALISWAAPGYLGSDVEFRAHYAEPIKNGLYSDSSSYEKRKSLMKLKVLHSDIQPKVNRATIEVLRGSLKSKVEFVITVPLSETQTELYKRYLRALLKGDEDSEASSVRIFGWLGVLTLLTNHPSCFRQKLLEPRKKTSGKQAEDDGDDDDDTNGSRTPVADGGNATPLHNRDPAPTADQAVEAEAAKVAPADKSLNKLGLTEEMVEEILDGYDEKALQATDLSAKVTIFLKLLDYSLNCKDKVIVFSGSIPTLKYLNELLTSAGHRFGCIDGSTNMQKRMEVLEDYHRDDFHIMLVSTRAGGVGLNIQGANRVFIFDFGFNPAWEEQAIGRAYRLGQTKPVYVYRFVAGGTFESNIYNKQLFKTSLAARVVDKKNPRRNASRDVREYLYEPKPVKQENLREWMGKDAKVLDRLLNRHGPGEQGKRDTLIRVIKTMETLNEEVLDEPLNEEEQREVDLEIAQGFNRAKGQRVRSLGGPPVAIPRVPSTQQAVGSGFVGPPPPPPPPPSTYAGPSNFPNTLHHPLGGLPMPRTQQPSRR